MKASKYTRETIKEIGMYDRDFPDFNVGDFIAVSLRVKEGGKERIQVFEGDVIAMNKNGASSSFTIRKIGANAVPVERVLPFYSPLIDSIKFIRSGKKRRAKLYYIRERIGKAARIAEKVLTREQKELRAQKKKAKSLASAKPAKPVAAKDPAEETVEQEKAPEKK
ncbi:50S ribosomal protein L19 [Candidatus Dependentiae bacterium]